jgi:hypothetical protein
MAAVLGARGVQGHVDGGWSDTDRPSSSFAAGSRRDVACQSAARMPTPAARRPSRARRPMTGTARVTFTRWVDSLG